jgi:hypothetical protein
VPFATCGFDAAAPGIGSLRADFAARFALESFAPERFAKGVPVGARRAVSDFDFGMVAFPEFSAVFGS